MDGKKPLQHHLEIEAANGPLSEDHKLVSDEMRAIYHNESEHFPVGRTLNFVSTLSLLFITSMMMGSKYQREALVPPVYSYVMLGFFVIYSIASTLYNAKVLKRIH
jgi:uncharacterized membrane protein YfcA